VTAGHEFSRGRCFRAKKNLAAKFATADSIRDRV
jgi:hypothetical protein